MKEYTLAIDPASRLCGVSLFHGDSYIASICLTSSFKTWSARASQMRSQLKDFVLEHLPQNAVITRAVIELIPKIVDPSVQLIAGAIIADPAFQINPTRKFFVSPSSWKAFARRKGCTMKDPKGVQALTEAGLQPSGNLEIKSEDIADSMLLYYYWLEKHETT